MPYCSYCGSSYKLGIDKCPKCGEDLPKLNSVAEGNNSSELLKKNYQEIDFAKVPVAGIAKRLAAGGVDLFIGIVLMIFIIRIVLFRYILRRAFIKGFLAFVIIYALSAVYFLLRDSLKGKSVGKLICSLTVVNLERKKPADLADSILRNSMLAIIVIPVFGWIIFSILSIIIIVQISVGKEQRIGDRFANTRVIEDRFMGNIYFK